AEAKPADAKVDTAKTDIGNAPLPADNKNADVKPADDKATDAKSTETKSTDTPAAPAVTVVAPAENAAPAPAATAAEPAATPAPAATALSAADQPIADKMKELLASKATKYFNRRNERAAVEKFYSERNYAPLWIDNGAENARAKAAVAYLKTVDTDGLDP